MTRTNDDLRTKLWAFMGEHDLAVKNIAILIDRHPLTVWKFLRGKTVPHERTLYRIRKLIGEI